LGTLHLDNSGDLALADEDGEWLLFFDNDNVHSDQDIHQWIFGNGTEAYYEPLVGTQVNVNGGGSYVVPEPIVVHVPHDSVKTFDVTFCWSTPLLDHASNFTHAEFRFYVNTHLQGESLEVSLNVPRDTSVRYTFNRRRNGRYAYRATPYNDDLASSTLSGAASAIPVDPNPPIIIT